MELRQYQKEIAQKANDILLKLKIVYLCCEVRTGKTLMALETAKLFDKVERNKWTKKRFKGNITYYLKSEVL